MSVFKYRYDETYSGDIAIEADSKEEADKLLEKFASFENVEKSDRFFSNLEMSDSGFKYDGIDDSREPDISAEDEELER